MDKAIIEYAQLLKDQYIRESCDYEEGLVIDKLEEFILEKINEYLPSYNKKIRNNPENTSPERICAFANESDPMQFYKQLMEEGRLFRAGLSMKNERLEYL